MTQFDSGRPDREVVTNFYMKRLTLVTQPSPGYALLDSGGQEKLERYGAVTLVRPDPQALWEKRLGESEWGLANGRYAREGREGKWELGGSPSPLAGGWPIEFGSLRFLIRPTSFKHTGLFPEQLPNWEWTRDILQRSATDRPAPRVLNLFGYTGGATLAAAGAGAEVTHVDASKTAVAWARENAALSGLAEKPVRWIVEDAMTFVKREIKRGSNYEGIIMDPPAFGHGPKDELWKIEEDFVELVGLCKQLLAEKPLFFLINGYAAGYSPLAFAYNLESLVKKHDGTIEYGDLSIAEEVGERVLPCGIFARWAR